MDFIHYFVSDQQQKNLKITFHHVITISLLYFSWMLNLYRVALVIVFYSHIPSAIYKLFKIFKIFHWNHALVWTFWIFFMARISWTIILLKISYFMIIANPIPLCPSFFFFNGLVLLLNFLNFHYTFLTFRFLVNCTQITFKSEYVP